jgi:hypothetical protein
MGRFQSLGIAKFGNQVFVMVDPFFGGGGIKLVRLKANLHGTAIPLGQGGFQPLFPQVTPGADHVGININGKGHESLLEDEIRISCPSKASLVMWILKNVGLSKFEDKWF